ncbi:hypothetical protein HY571_00640 [Candidatus Micrarchaeota archaeon]|nr:hypothetical protein [Candidatus Micrarchaeota archaeon]
MQKSEQVSEEQEIREKQEQFHGLLTKEAAGRIIHKQNIKRETQKTPLEGLAAGQRVSNNFQVIRFFEPKRFEKDNRSGIVLNLLVKNQEKEALLTLWNRDCEKILASDLNINDEVLVLGAIVRNVNPLELNSDILTKVEKTKSGKVETTPLEKISAGDALITTSGFVSNIGEVKLFAKEKTQGKLCRAVISNETNIGLVCWGEYADALQEIENGSKIIMVDSKAKHNKFGAIELHSTSTTRLVVTGERQLAQEKNISELKQGEAAVINGEVKELREVKNITLCSRCFTSIKSQCQCGGQPRQSIVAEAVIADQTGQITCSFFDSRALRFLNMKFVSPDLAEMTAELKRESIKEKPVKLLVLPKFNNFLNALTTNCKQVL